MYNEHQQLSFSLLLSTLHELCKIGKTGTMYISTDNNHAGRFTLKDGEIIACGFSAKRGKKALEMIRNITAGKYAFIESKAPAEPSQDISSTQETLDYLAENITPATVTSLPSQAAEQSPGSGNPFSNEATTSTASQQPLTNQDTDSKAEERKVDIPRADLLMELLQEELALYLGPLGPTVCKMHANQIIKTHTTNDLRAVIAALSEEIATADDARAFQKGVWARLT